jgi:hypothetical protein
MAEGQIRKDLIKKARKTPAKPAETTKVEESDDPNSQASIDAGSLEGKVSPAPTIREEREGLSPDKADIALDAAFAQMDSQDKAQEQVLADRRGIASGLKDLSKRGALTGDLLKEARQRATAAGVSEEQFSSFMGKEDIKTQNFATAAPTESKEEAAQNVMFQRQYGTGLGTLAAMQDPNYELGSGSALRQPARSIGPASGKFRRAARRLRRQGYGAAAQQMAAAGELARMGEPSIDTPALRGQRMAQRIAAAKEARKQDKIASQNPLPAANNQPDFKIPMAPAPDSDQITTQPKVMSPTEKNKADAAARYKKAEQERLKRVEDYGKPYKLS